MATESITLKYDSTTRRKAITVESDDTSKLNYLKTLIYLKNNFSEAYDNIFIFSDSEHFINTQFDMVSLGFIPYI